MMDEGSPLERENTVPSSSRPRTWRLPLVTGIAGFLLGALALAGIQAIVSVADAAWQPANTNATAGILKRALVNCALQNSPDVKLGDGGYTLTVNGLGASDSSGVPYEAQTCLEQVLRTPLSVIAHIEQTTPLDGRQSATWGHVTMKWLYQPDTGLSSVYTISH
jgi:hypothetical protein